MCAQGIVIGEIQMRVLISKEKYTKMEAHARACLPNEACGLIGGEDTEEGVRVIRQVYCLRNIDASDEHFSLDPAEQLSAVKDMRQHGWKPLGNWHSHPATPSRPSQEDIRLAYDSQASYLILSLEYTDAPSLNAFHVEKGKVRKEDLYILQDV